ncbi:MAG: DUF4350 domain-containing protein, partial [Candidatus Eremiobacteraeota bacterium]|nr:DUF4350 domain-containing protein [Candidatus Eremiobacteraeota bacterium]
MNVVAALRRLPPLETALFVLGVVVAVALATGAGVEQQPLPLDSFSSYDAASGGYRAYYSLLERLGVRVARFERRPAFLGAGIDTLAYVEPYDFDPRAVRLTAADLAALEAWVRAGGRLLYVGRDDVAAKNGLLHLPFSTRESTRAHVPFIAAQIARDDVRRVRAETHYRWKPSKRRFDVLVDDGRGPLAVTYAFGRGRVTALIDEGLLRNDGIGTPDRARLGYALAAPGRANGTVAFDETPHGYIVEAQWWQVVPRAFAIAIGIAFAAIVIALAGAAVRFGPPIVPIERRERSSADFVDALSSLLERGNAVRK